jgi:hypothetical protein
MAGERFGERVQRSGDVTDDPDVDRVVHVDLGGKTMNVDDPLVGVRVDPDGVEFL